VAQPQKSTGGRALPAEAGHKSPACARPALHGKLSRWRKGVDGSLEQKVEKKGSEKPVRMRPQGMRSQQGKIEHLQQQIVRGPQKKRRKN